MARCSHTSLLRAAKEAMRKARTIATAARRNPRLRTRLARKGP